MLAFKSRDVAGSTVTALRDGQPRNRGSSPAVARDSSVLCNVQTVSQFYATSYSVDTGLERPRRGADHSTQSSAEMKNKWSRTTTNAAMLFVA